MAKNIQLFNKQGHSLNPYTDSFKNVIQKIPTTLWELQERANSIVLYLGPDDEDILHGHMYKITEEQVVIDGVGYKQYSWQDVSPFTPEYIKQKVAQDTILQSGYWYICEASNITLTLPQGTDKASIKVSTTLATSNIIVAPHHGDNIQGDTEGFVIDKTSGAVQFYYTQGKWTVVDIGSLISITEDSLPLAGGTMTGPITKATSNNVLAKGQDTKGLLRIYGGTYNADGSYLQLSGNQSQKQGAFQIVTTNAQTGERHSLKCDRQGNFIYDGNHIIRTVNETRADHTGNVYIRSISYPAYIEQNFDLDTCVANCYYICSTDVIAQTVANSPSNVAFALEVFCGYSQIIYQRLTRYGDSAVFVRRFYKGTWSKWKHVLVFQGDSPRWGNKDISLGYPKYEAAIDLGFLPSYTVEVDGWLYIQYKSSDFWKLYVNGGIAFSEEGANSCLLPVKKDEIISIYSGQTSTTVSTPASAKLTFYPNK